MQYINKTRFLQMCKHRIWRRRDGFCFYADTYCDLDCGCPRMKRWEKINKKRSNMKFTKTITRTYDIRLLGSINMSNRFLIEFRKKYGFETRTTCFMCDKKLNMDDRVIFAAVKGREKVLICKECKLKLLEADGDKG